MRRTIRHVRAHQAHVDAGHVANNPSNVPPATSSAVSNEVPPAASSATSEGSAVPTGGLSPNPQQSRAPPDQETPAPSRVMEWDTQMSGGQTALWLDRSVSPHLWDVTLATDDGHKILACRKDLCVFSEYFSCIFRGVWKQDDKENVVVVRNVPGTALENIIAAYYGCKVSHTGPGLCSQWPALS
jgi:BTB/POZ domain